MPSRKVQEVEYAYDEDVKRVGRGAADAAMRWVGKRAESVQKINRKKIQKKKFERWIIKMKKKFMAFMLAAVLGVTGIAATAQAAEGGKPGETVQAPCPNGHIWYANRTMESYAENGALGHYKITTAIYHCHGCDEIDYDYSKVLEDHTLVMPPLGARWDCIYCEYYEEIYCP